MPTIDTCYYATICVKMNRNHVCYFLSLCSNNTMSKLYHSIWDPKSKLRYIVLFSSSFFYFFLLSSQIYHQHSTSKHHMSLSFHLNTETLTWLKILNLVHDKVQIKFQDLKIVSIGLFVA